MFSNKSLQSTTNKLTNPAKYNKIVQFEEMGKYQNDDGHWIEGWVESDLRTTYAQIRNIRGNEFIMAGAEQVKVSARINTRYRQDVEEKYYNLGEKLRMKYVHPKTNKERIFEITYLNNLEEKNIEFEFIVNEVR
ncbi:phage head closure protein [Oceanobacillus profundus]|uniref:phage head closure protein n=1 Tax=Oceanobacillus TaxID=182709 RepID=UPI00203A84E0|nr:phage head closure protein [Oceanobacillus profundus]MCM3396787.1 phage head closure protein [Oceanobacillus profundus]MDO6448089.1 phage head closure protein [Oceanobacillus profundus]